MEESLFWSFVVYLLSSFLLNKFLLSFYYYYLKKKEREREKERKKLVLVENMGSIWVFRWVYLVFLLAFISEVGFGKMVFNVMNDGANADGNTDNSKVCFAK